MSNERAIEILKNLEYIKVLENNVHNSKSACKKDNEEYSALQMAIQALERQAPKKPVSLKADVDIKIGAGTWKRSATVYKCSCCNNFISRSSNFCDKCGQVLDWSETE